MTIIHMLDEAATARAKLGECPKTGKSWRKTWCGLIEETTGPEGPEEFLYFTHPNESEDVTCPNCIELLKLAPWAGRTVRRVDMTEIGRGI